MADNSRHRGEPRKTYLLPGRIEIPLKKMSSREGIYHMGAWGELPQTIDLSLYKVMVFDSRDYPGHKTLILTDKRQERQEVGEDQE